MTRAFKSIGVVMLACLMAGLIAHWVLSTVSRKDSTVSASPPPMDSSSASTSSTAMPEPPPPGWVFRLAASARDDPETGRALLADVHFEGTVPSCPASSNRGGQALGVDESGGVAAASREATVCLPGCPGQVPPAPRGWAASRPLDVSAFQEEFERATSDYGPQARAAVVDWQCGAVAGRVTAAAVVALACDADACGDAQKANASVYLGAEQGHSVGPAKAFFALRSVSGQPVVGTAELH